MPCIKTYLDSNLIAYISVDRNIDENKSKTGTFLNKTEKTQILNLFDLKKDRILSQIKYQQPIINFNISFKKLYVILETEIFIYDLFTYANTHYIKTKPNPNGLFTNSINDDIIVYPGESKYHLIVNNLVNQVGFELNFEDNYQCFTMNKSASLLAVANTSGSQIKIYDLETQQIIKVLKRGGMGDCIIHNITFNEDDTLLAAALGKGEIQLWNAIESKEGAEGRILEKISFGIFSSGEKSIAKLNLRENITFVGFVGGTNQLLVIGGSAMAYFCDFKIEKGVADIKVTKGICLLS